MKRLTKLKHYDDYAVRYGNWWEWKTKKGKLVTMLELNRLAEYENTGLTPKEVEELKHELEVYKKALELACNVVADEYNCTGRPDEEVSKEYVIEYLDNARKELEDERKTN